MLYIKTGLWTLKVSHMFDFSVHLCSEMQSYINQYTNMYDFVVDSSSKLACFLKHFGIEHLKNQTAPWFETFTECTKSFTLQTVQISWNNELSSFARGQSVLYNAEVLRL